MATRLTALLLAMVLLLAGCTVTDVPETTDSRTFIGICFPDNRWKAEAKRLSDPLTAAGYRVEVEYANGDPQIQQMQLDSLLSRCVDLLILCAIDSLALSEPLQQAKAEAVPVLAYDRMLMGTDAVSACVAPDTFSAGKQLGQYIQDTLSENVSTLELFMGSPENNNDYLFHAGLMTALQPHIESGKLSARSGRTTFEDTCVQDGNPFTAKNYLLDYLLDYYGDTLPDILITGGIGMAQRCAEAFPDEAEKLPLMIGIGEKESTEPFAAYACFDRESLTQECVKWAQLLLEDPDRLPRDTVQHNGAIDVPTFLQTPETVK